jgi:transcriptional regulator with XRE-family HTH domain
MTRQIPGSANKKQFGRHLEQLMLSKEMNQSDLARAAFGSIENGDGRTVARRRDSISSYIRGLAWPDRKSQLALAKALGIPTEELVPNSLVNEIDRGTAPPLCIQEILGQPGKAWLQINRIISLETAVKVLQLINAEG